MSAAGAEGLKGGVPLSFTGQLKTELTQLPRGITSVFQGERKRWRAKFLADQKFAKVPQV